MIDGGGEILSVWATSCGVSRWNSGSPTSTFASSESDPPQQFELRRRVRASPHAGKRPHCTGRTHRGNRVGRRRLPRRARRACASSAYPRTPEAPAMRRRSRRSRRSLRDRACSRCRATTPGGRGEDPSRGSAILPRPHSPRGCCTPVVRHRRRSEQPDTKIVNASAASAVARVARWRISVQATADGTASIGSIGNEEPGRRARAAPPHREVRHHYQIRNEHEQQFEPELVAAIAAGPCRRGRRTRRRGQARTRADRTADRTGVRPGRRE